MNQDYRNAALPLEQRVQSLLAQMTLEEKTAQLDMTRGVEFATKIHPAHFCAVDETSDFDWEAMKENFGDRGVGFVHDVYSVPAVLNKVQRFFVEHTRLGIPCIFTGEALHGLSYPGATSYPIPLALGATFDPELVRRVGREIGAETRGLGIHEILAPNLDVARDPRWGRTEETFGEDTYLSARMAAAIISGEQGDGIGSENGVACEPKHYCVHGMPEGGRNCAPARVGVREVESCYLPVFEAGIREGGARNVMASYNCIDGEAVIASEHYLREVLHDRWGMKGYVRADFGAVNRLQTHHRMTASGRDSIRTAFNAGLQVQGFDFPSRFWEETLAELVRAGEIPAALLDDAVARVLRLKLELGLFERPYTDEERYRAVIRCAGHRETCYRAALEGVVLLQNKNQVLPIRPEVKKIALLGPGSGVQRLGGYASVPYGYTVPSLYEELSRALDGRAEVRQCDGCGITEKDFTSLPKTWYPEGVQLEFYPNDRFEGEPVGRERAAQIAFNWILAKPHRDLDYVGYSVRMRGRFHVHTADFSRAGDFTGRLVFSTNDSVRVWVDGALLIESWGGGKQVRPSCPFRFRDGAEHTFQVEYVCDVNGNNLSLGVEYHEDTFDQAVALAGESDLAILVCGDDQYTSGEGMDRCGLTLYGRQQELIRAVAALGKPTVLVLENGKPLDMREESGQADAILSAWFGGELGAKAIADLLTGAACPSGKLPISFPRGVGQLPCYYSRLPGGNTDYLEGDASALFPFGHGLSYTEFSYDRLQIEKGAGEYEWTVSADIQNIGSLPGDEVVQLYISDLQSSVVTPEKLLKGFSRISLEPGERKTVSFPISFDSLKLLNQRMEWVVEPGEFALLLGSSSRDIRLKGSITVARG